MASGIVESQNQGSGQQQQQQQGTAGKRSKLVERLLDASSNLPAFMKDLLGTIAVTVAGTAAAGLLRARGGSDGSRHGGRRFPDRARREAASIGAAGDHAHPPGRVGRRDPPGG